MGYFKSGSLSNDNGLDEGIMMRTGGTNWISSVMGMGLIVAAVALPNEVSAQTLRSDPADDRPPVSICQAIARAPYRSNIIKASTQPLSREQVRISFVDHSTYYIEGPDGTSIATDYNGYLGRHPAPTVATMNKAHSSHYTLYPDPAIVHVLPGWHPEGGGIDHDILVGETYVRNVTTDIRSGFSGAEPDGNSIFIFEIAGLCIGHLGHLHHALEDRHIAEIGRLDVVMVPIDGGLTLGHESLSETVKRLRASIILPMHRRGRAINSFLDLFGEDFGREFRLEDSFTVSMRTLPRKPTIIVLDGV